MAFDGICQNPGCRSTTSQSKKQGWHFDHDHITGKFRGILCAPCNLFIGLAKDDTAVLAGAIEYLERSRGISTPRDVHSGFASEHAPSMC
jgi:recombination endonuclease VII